MKLFLCFPNNVVPNNAALPRPTKTHCDGIQCTGVCNPFCTEYFCRKLCGRRGKPILRNSFIVGMENSAKYSAHCFLWQNCPFSGSCSSAFQFSYEGSPGCVHRVQDGWMWRNLHHPGWWDINQLLLKEQRITQYSKTAFTRSDLALNMWS